MLIGWIEITVVVDVFTIFSLRYFLVRLSLQGLGRGAHKGKEDRQAQKKQEMLAVNNFVIHICKVCNLWMCTLFTGQICYMIQTISKYSVTIQ